MAYRCPVCLKETTTVGTFFSHVINIPDETHRDWLREYCRLNGINLMKLLGERAMDIKGANKPLTDAFRRDFFIG